MERSPIISWLFHTRIVRKFSFSFRLVIIVFWSSSNSILFISVLLGLLGSVDVYFISFAYHHTVTKGASVQLVFGFEYAILLTVVLNTAIKYVLHIIDMNREVFWENKAVFLLHIEVLIGLQRDNSCSLPFKMLGWEVILKMECYTGLVKVGLYMIFVALMIKLYTLPLFAFRPMYYSMRWVIGFLSHPYLNFLIHDWSFQHRNFKKALNDVIQSRRAIRNMNTLYPDATAEELAAADNVCIICREEMQAGMLWSWNEVQVYHLVVVRFVLTSLWCFRSQKTSM